jgi:hypothetical protein
MTTLDAQARADIASRPWYVAAFRGRDIVNQQPFRRLRPGRRLVSLSRNGFRLFDEPSHMIGFGYAFCMPWDVWQVRPLRPLRYQPTSVPDFATRQLRARRIEVVAPRHCQVNWWTYRPRVVRRFWWKARSQFTFRRRSW